MHFFYSFYGHIVNIPKFKALPKIPGGCNTKSIYKCEEILVKALLLFKCASARGVLHVFTCSDSSSHISTFIFSLLKRGMKKDTKGITTL